MWIGIGIGIGRTRYGTGGTPASLLLDAYTGAAAAYSLRKLSSDASSAIQVRRSSDNDILDIGFVGGELDTATLETFVNAQDVAPADYGSGAAAAYSLRYVSASYTGDVIQVRRSSDNTTQDFNPTEITDGTLATFCSAGDGFVTTWYDQSGNGYHAKQTIAANQPKVVSAGSVITKNGNPAVDFDGSDDGLFTLNPISINNYPITITSVFDATDSLSGIKFVAGSASFGSGEESQVAVAMLNGKHYFETKLPTTGLLSDKLATYNVHTALSNGTTVSQYANGSLRGSASMGSTQGNLSLNFSIGNSASLSHEFNGPIQEVIVYPSDESSNRPKIEANINNYYSIYTNTNNGFVTTWYDQSGNGNHATQSSASSQPQIVISGSVITENGKPSVQFDGSNDYLFTTNLPFVFPTTAILISTTVSINNNYLFDTFIPGQDVNINRMALRYRTENGGAFAIIDQNGAAKLTTNTYIANNQFLNFINFDNPNTNIYTNNSNQDTVSTTYVNSTRTFNIGTYSGANNVFHDGTIQELILYLSDQSSNRTGIETNINAEYQIYWDGSQTSLLDSYSGSSAAYSLRALSSSYTGPLVEVRRLSDNATQDIYAKYDGTLNVDALESFCSGTDGHVTTWYDQSGNGIDATQTTAANQPQIVSSGSVITENGKPAIDFDGSDDSLVSTLSILTSDITTVAIIKNTVVSNAPYLANSGDASFGTTLGNVNNVMRIQNTSSSSVNYANSIITNVQSLQLVTRNGTTWNWYENSVSKGSKTLSGNMNLKSIGARLGGFGQLHFNGTIQETLIYPSDESSNRSGIETNINDFYSIY